MAKGFLPQCCVGDFPEEPEKACKTLSAFLHCWFRENLKKPDARKALGIANPKLSSHDKNVIVGKLQLYRQWSQKKKKNLRNGEKTDPAILHVLASLQPDTEPVKGPKPARRLRKKTPQKEAEMSEAASSAAAILPEQGTMPGEDSQPEQRKALTILSSSPGSPGSPTQASIAGSVVSLSSASSCIAGSALKKACKRPAAASGGSPAKRPAMATKKPAGKASGLKQRKWEWVKSSSFGWLKATAATEKGYICAKPEQGSKAYCQKARNKPMSWKHVWLKQPNLAWRRPKWLTSRTVC